MRRNYPYPIANPPPPVTTNLARWDGIPASNSDGAEIVQWSDSGPSASFHLTQVTSANRPIWRSPRISDLGVADFDGVDDWLGSTISASTLDSSFFALINLRVVPPTVPACIYGPSNTGGLSLQVGTDRRISLSKYGTATLGTHTTQIPQNSWVIIHGSVTATTWEISINGDVQRGTHAQTLTAALTLRMGGGNAANFFNGFIAWGARIPTSELGIDGAERWVGKIAWQYGLQNNLPDSHPYRFESPGEDIEHAWVVEAQDEIGGVTGSASYGYDEELPDTSIMRFYTSATAYSVRDSPFIPDVSIVNSKTKLTTRTPQYFRFFYQHPLGINSAAIRFRIAKKNIDNEWSSLQESAFFFTSIAPGGNFVWHWWRSLFRPLDFGEDYAVECQFIDSNGVRSAWTGRREFHLNYFPHQGIVSSPTNPTPVTSPPLVLLSADDDDDAGVAYYAAPDWAIWEAEVGTTGAGTSPVQFSAPYQCNIDASGNVYIADSGNGRIMKLTEALVFVAQFTDPIVGNRGVVVDASGNIYSTDWSNLVVKKYSSAGALLATSPAIPTTSGFGPRVPWYLANMNDTTLLVSIPGSTLGFTYIPMSSMNPGGIWSTTDGKGDNRQKNIVGVAYGNTNLSEPWIADSLDAYIKTYNIGRIFKQKWAEFDLIREPLSIAIHPNTGNVWILDRSRRTVMEFSRYGDYLGEMGPIWIGSGGVADLFTSGAAGFCFNLTFDKFFVVDTLANNIMRFRITDSDERNAGCAGEVAIKGPIPIANQGFESGIGEWTYNEGTSAFVQTISVQTASPAEGAQHLRVNLSAGPATPNVTSPATSAIRMFSNHTSADEFPVVEGYSYQASAKFRRSKKGFYGQIGIIWTVPGLLNLQIVSWSPIVKPAANTWVEMRVSDTAPPGATSAQIYLWAGVDPEGATYPIDIDFDDVQVEDGVRYIRGATFLGGDDYSYQVTATDMPVLGTYTLMSRGRDGNNPGDWSEPVTIYYIVGPTATIISPTPGQVFTTATPIFLWQLTSGSQWAYKVEVLDTNGIIVYTSDWVQSTNARSHQVPQSAGLQDNTSYIGRLWIDDGNIQVLV